MTRALYVVTQAKAARNYGRCSREKTMPRLCSSARTNPQRCSREGTHLITTGPEVWLVGERPPPGEKGEHKYYFSTLPADTPLERLARLTHARWTIEQLYEDAKRGCGLGDCQGRWDGLHRRLALVMLAYSFLTLQRSTT
jgi:SRSO17 transposase